MLEIDYVLFYKLAAVAADAAVHHDNPRAIKQIINRASAKIHDLLIQGANIDVSNAVGDTALHLACSKKENLLEIVKMLLFFKADMLKSNKNGETPLHHAARYNHVAIVELFIDADADVNSCDKHGKTPLHIAIQYDHTELETLLRNAGATIADAANDATLVNPTGSHQHSESPVGCRYGLGITASLKGIFGACLSPANKAGAPLRAQYVVVASGDTTEKPLINAANDIVTQQPKAFTASKN